MQTLVEVHGDTCKFCQFYNTVNMTVGFFFPAHYLAYMNLFEEVYSKRKEKKKIGKKKKVGTNVDNARLY